MAQAQGLSARCAQPQLRKDRGGNVFIRRVKNHGPTYIKDKAPLPCYFIIQTLTVFV